MAATRTTIMKNAGMTVTFYVEHLDLFRFNGDRYQASLEDFYREKYRDKPIGVIVVIGTTAFRYALQLRDAVWPTSQIVFAAVEKETGLRDRQPGVTGITMDMTLASMMKAAQIVVPDLRGFALVGTPLEQQIYYRHFAEELPKFSREFQYFNLMGLNVDEVRKRVSALPEKTAILYIGINFDQRTTYVAAEVVPLIAEVANRPIIVNAETFVGTGAAGGFILTPGEIGKDAGQLALRVLNGESAAAIPVTAGDAPRPIFDWRQLQRWNVSQSSLPPGSEIRYRELGVWQQYRAQIVAISAAIVAQAALIMWLLYEQRRRQTAEVKARTAISKLSGLSRLAVAGELSASIAHEVNQPLTGITTRANAALRWLADDAPDVGKVRVALTDIEQASHRASDIVQSVRTMFRKETRINGLVDINMTILSVLELARFDLQTNDVEIQTDLDKRIPGVIGDEGQLQQVILNLVMNANESMSSVQPRTLRLSTELGANEIQVSIEDTGTGIDPSDRDRIFESMFTTKTGGMGMGLAICRSIVESHNGRVWATNGTHNGATFRIALPLIPSPAMCDSSIPSKPASPALDDRRGVNGIATAMRCPPG